MPRFDANAAIRPLADFAPFCIYPGLRDTPKQQKCMFLYKEYYKTQKSRLDKKYVINGRNSSNKPKIGTFCFKLAQELPLVGHLHPPNNTYKHIHRHNTQTKNAQNPPKNMCQKFTKYATFH